MTRKQGKIAQVNSLHQKNREKHFEEVYRRYFDQLYAYARVICNSQNLAKDVVSDFFYNLWKNQTDLTQVNNLEGYLFVSVKNQAIQSLNRNNREISHEGLEIKIGSIDYINPEELLLEKELKVTLDKIILDLPDQCQLVFRMAKEQGMKYAEISEELNISVETVKSQLKKAQGKLRTEILKFYLDTESSSLPDVRLIGQLLLLAALPYCEIAS